MIVGIDASNIHSGGGVTHLVELLRKAAPAEHGISKVIIWSGQSNLDRIENRGWLIKAHNPLLDKGLLYRTFWQRFKLTRLARNTGCDVLFVPGGSYAGDFHPIVSLSQNLLPFEPNEMKRFGWSWMTMKFLLLRYAQSRTFRHSDGLIFLTSYAHEAVMRMIKKTAGSIAIIPHGVENEFFTPPREQLPIDRYSFSKPYRIIYVSKIDMYKHQWKVAEAVSKLRSQGLPVVLDLTGPAYRPALKILMEDLARIDPVKEFVHYSGNVPHINLRDKLGEVDLFLFASSCENLPNILLEGMAAGLPIACSQLGPMPEILGDAGVYFDPESPDDISHALLELIKSPELRERLSKASFRLAHSYSWNRCAGETFDFIAHVYNVYKNDTAETRNVEV